jgi:hypothetical protein
VAGILVEPVEPDTVAGASVAAGASATTAGYCGLPRQALPQGHDAVPRQRARKEGEVGQIDREKLVAAVMRVPA